MWEKAEKALLKDKYIRPLIKKYGPCKIRPSRKKDYFTDLVDAIVSQQLSGKAARTIFERVKVGLGGQITPDNLLKTKDEKLRSWGLSRAKTLYVKDLAQRVKSGELKVRKLDKLSDEEVLRELIAVKGIGRWTAEMFLMFTLARQDVFPVDDLGITKGMKKLLNKTLSPERNGIFAIRWKPFRTLAAWYVWEAVDNN
ncbi:MAG: putative DNA-3-methyladenine glycosylase [Candidatus Woesebacteria bacterium GW2011_GWA1_45_8]|uniref:DNA-3-methyladenine glycosylase II n=1 Tax=Candidatus Woesebacteria bacterium GW2011_GWA1_45_8 TaxID=1618559 RepID=A0A0G1MW05_9BACT|nr:MAG: putative DNA-3-methyladenine glycosylase [Candidatus Woesebacteria bacterium GW2011_GWA1_45_8]